MMDQAATNDRMRQTAQLQVAKRELSEAQTLHEMRNVRDLAEAIRSYAQHRDLGLDVQNQAAELKLQAERRLGRELGNMNLRGGDRKSAASGLTLRDLGIDKNQSARWQLEASVPDDVFQHYILTAHAEGREISSAALLRLGRRMKQLQAVSGGSGSAAHPPAEARARDSQRALVSKNVQLFAMRTESPRKVGPIGELGDLVEEVKNHGQTLTRMVESLCDRADLHGDASERRAVRRYFREIERNLEQIDFGLERLARDQRFLTSAFAS